MKKIITFLIVLLFTVTLFANPVSEKQARKIALNFYTHYAKKVKSDLSIKDVKEYKYENITAFYIYRFKNGGFVIVSADDAVIPVLGYSVENKLNLNKPNPAFEEWIENYAKQIKEIVDAKLDNSQTLVEWNKILNNDFSKKSQTTVEPLLTTEWDQMGHYNDMCPNDDPTGCVATAMAQIMKFYNYPDNGFSQHSYVHPTYGTLSANFKNTTYDWDNMPNQVTTVNIPVATLMYHCGVAVDMDYDPNGSGAQTRDVTYALANYFGYDQSINYVQMADYSSSDWINLLKAQLDNSHPVLYSGSSSSSGGHAFVCDGYNASDQFHFNWGWGGYENGYYAIGSLNPGGEDFNDDNAAVINIFPAIDTNFYAVKEFSDLSTFASNQSPYIGYIQTPNEYVAWGIARDGSGSQAYYRIFTKTTDGGLTWQAGKIDSLGGTAFSMIYGLDDSTAYIAMWGSNQQNNKILRTTDGGQNWQVVLTGGHSASFFNVVHFFDKNNGFVEGDPDSEFELYTTTDGGDTWTRVDGSNIPDPLSGEYGITGMYTAVGDTIWFSTNKGRIYKSEDKGHTWTVTQILNPGSNNDTYIDLAFSDNGQTGLALVTLTDGTNFSYHYFKTTDGGDTWTEITSPSGNFYNGDVSAVPGVDGMFVSCGSDYQTPKMGISYSLDGGNTWTDYADYYKNFQFTSIAMASQNKGFVGSFTGVNSDGAWMFGNKEPLVANFASDDSLACVNTDVTFTSLSTGDIDTYEWNFGEGANPQTSTGIGPHTVQYTTPGNKTVTLTVSNNDMSNTMINENCVLVSDAAPAEIDTIEGPTLVLRNSVETYSVASQANSLFNWSLDQSLWTLTADTNVAQIQFGSFLLDGNLSVYAYNGCGQTDTSVLHIQVTDQLPENINKIENDVKISPNPASDVLYISSSKQIQKIEIVSSDGKIVKSISDCKETVVDVSNLKKGIYFVKITTDDGTKATKILLE